jgi:hypothetical protein
MRMHAKIVRVFFNRREDAPRVWSVDFGSDSEIEILCSVVLIGGIHLTSHFDSTVVGTSSPCAWLEGHDAAVEIRIDEVVITEWKYA